MVRKQSTSSPSHVLYEEIVNDIRQGTLRPGDELDGGEAFAERKGVSRATAFKVYRRLEENGYVEAGPGKTTRVRRNRGIWLLQRIADTLNDLEFANARPHITAKRIVTEDGVVIRDTESGQWIMKEAI